MAQLIEIATARWRWLVRRSTPPRWTAFNRPTRGLRWTSPSFGAGGGWPLGMLQTSSWRSGLHWLDPATRSYCGVVLERWYLRSGVKTLDLAFAGWIRQRRRPERRYLLEGVALENRYLSSGVKTPDLTFAGWIRRRRRESYPFLEASLRRLAHHHLFATATYCFLSFSQKVVFID